MQTRHFWYIRSAFPYARAQPFRLGWPRRAPTSSSRQSETEPFLLEPHRPPLKPQAQLWFEPRPSSGRNGIPGSGYIHAEANAESRVRPASIQGLKSAPNVHGAHPEFPDEQKTNPGFYDRRTCAQILRMNGTRAQNHPQQPAAPSESLARTPGLVRRLYSSVMVNVRSSTPPAGSTVMSRLCSSTSSSLVSVACPVHGSSATKGAPPAADHTPI